MNKYQLYTLSGTLLAATSLAGAAYAAPQGVGHVTGTTFTSGAIKVATTIFSSTASSAAAQTIGNGGAGIAISFLNSYDSTFNLQVTVPISGATYNATPVVKYIVRDPAISITGSTVGTVAAGASISGTPPTVSSISNTLFISNLQMAVSSVNTINSAQIGGIILSSVVFTSASGLASGGSVALAATVQNASGSTTYESIASTAILTGIAPLSTVVTPGTNAVVNANSSPTLFTNFFSGGGSGLTLTLATVAITATGAVGTDLATLLTSDGTNGAPATGSAILTISSDALKDPAASGLEVTAAGVPATSTTAGVQTLSTGTFSSGTVTFTIAAATNAYVSTLSVNLLYNGSSAISSALAGGTVAVAYSAGGESLVAPSGGSGTTATISRGGLTAEVNYANNGLGALGFFSFIRIHNKGTSAATASITVKNDATGAQIGTTTFTTGSIAAGGTIQVAVSDIEKGLSVTPTANVTYTLSITGGFPGYVQHITYNPTSGAFGELDGYRNSGNANSTP